MSKVKEHRGWDYWLDADNGRYIAAKFDGDGGQASDSIESSCRMELLEKINAAEDATMVFADIEPKFSVCPACYGEGDSLGVLGGTMYSRCRYCGMTYS